MPPPSPPPSRRAGAGEEKGKSKRAPLKILCFGDSLTAGTPAGHPYGGKLEERLVDALPHLEPICEVEGVPGDRVTPHSYRRRMEKAWDLGTGASGAESSNGRNGVGVDGSHSDDQDARKEAAEADKGGQQQQEPAFHWTVVLGGTNDLAWGVSAAAVVEGLKETWDVALRRGGKVLALTVPEVRHDSEVRRETRDEINTAIKSYKKHNFFHFDLHAAIPWKAMPAGRRARVWEPDGVHLTEEGYDLMGERVADAVARIERLAEARSTDILGGARDARRRRAAEERNIAFEEERGDHRLLSQGYIVVRRTDLD